MMMLSIGKNKQAAGLRLEACSLKHKRGFTLIEIMLSIAILSIGLVLILQGFIHCLNCLRISEDNLKASLMAGNKMAEAEIQAKEDWDDFKRGLNKRFKFEGLKCIWDIEVKQVAWDMEKIPQSYKSLFEVRAVFTWEEGRRKGMIPLFTYMRSHDE